MKLIRNVTLNDEHKQPISIYQNEKGYWWVFTTIMGEKHGPHSSPAAAYLDAEAYCSEGAAGG